MQNSLDDTISKWLYAVSNEDTLYIMRNKKYRYFFNDRNWGFHHETSDNRSLKELIRGLVTEDKDMLKTLKHMLRYNLCDYHEMFKDKSFINPEYDLEENKVLCSRIIENAYFEKYGEEYIDKFISDYNSKSEHTITMTSDPDVIINVSFFKPENNSIYEIEEIKIDNTALMPLKEWFRKINNGN